MRIVGARGAVLVFCALLSPIAQAQSAKEFQNLLDSGLKKAKERDFDGAIAAYTQALAINAKHGQAMSLRAEARLRLEDYDGAVADSTKAIDIDRKLARAYAVRSLANQRRQDPANSPIGDAKEAVSLDSKDATCHLALAYSFARGYSQFDRAIEKIAPAIELDPAMACCARAEFKLWKGDHSGAIEDAGRAIEVAPGDPEAYVVRGRVYEELRQWDNAFADYSRAIDLDPKGVTGLVYRGGAYNLRRRYAEAAADASKALSLRPQSVAALDLRAKARLQSGNRKDALADFDQLIKLRPTRWGYRDRGWARVADGAWADAAADFRKYTPMGNDEKLARSLWICVCRIRSGEATQAREELLKEYEFGKQSSSDWDGAVFQYLTGQMAEDKFLSTAAHPKPDVASHRLCAAGFYIGMLKAAEGRIGGAISAYERCLATKQWWMDEYMAAAADLERLKK